MAVYVSVWVCTCVSGCLWRTEALCEGQRRCVEDRGIDRIPRTGAVGSEEPLDKCWGLNSSALQKQQVLLMSELSLQTIAELYMLN